jgi:SAM-dependent MidA family methyltransferase
MQPSTDPNPSAAIMGALRRRAGGKPALSFEEYMEVALYEPALGYYRRDVARIGYGAGTDFLTATTSSPLFGKLVVAAVSELVGPGGSPGLEFVELGAEVGPGILDGVPHPFRSARVVRVGEPLVLEGPSVVFSNELFDAQPFRRFRFRGGSWRELGVCVAGAGPEEVELGPGVPQPAALPGSPAEGYVIDAPVAAAELARTIAGQPWTGLFLAFDYGKSWEEIAFDAPAGTARAYHRHVQGNNLLAFPGEQDLTCHVCWDWLKEALLSAGFADPRVESQEAFFTRHAGSFIEAFAASEAGRVSREKLSLLQLLHPAHMGQKFQALWAIRPPGRP